MPKQLTANLLMVRPANFGFNPETADNNSFQINDTRLSVEAIKTKAIQEFDVFVKKLRAVDIHVTVVQDTAEPIKTDAVFPNNWISFHEDGLIVTYPMFSPNRRLERRQEVINQLSQNYTFINHIRLEKWEANPQYLEGTGSIVLDRANQIAYACLSERTDPQLFKDYCEFMHFEEMAFHSVDSGGIPIYHTNVMMAMGTKFVIICLETILDIDERNKLKKIFKRTNKEIIAISIEQMNSFAGNMLQVKNKKGASYLVMSTQAFHSLEDNQIAQIEEHAIILHSDIKTIETYGGGSARCMIAEVF